jgi:hypothetical protein
MLDLKIRGSPEMTIGDSGLQNKSGSCSQFGPYGQGQSVKGLQWYDNVLEVCPN